jgi:hypothetical protein
MAGSASKALVQVSGSRVYGVWAVGLGQIFDFAFLRKRVLIVQRKLRGLSVWKADFHAFHIQQAIDSYALPIDDHSPPTSAFRTK